MSGIYRINGKRVSHEEFLAGSKGIDFSKPFRMAIGRDYEAYACPVTGKMIEGRAAHAENLKRTGCRLLETGETEQFIKDRPARMEAAAEETATFLAEKIAEKID